MPDGRILFQLRDFTRGQFDQFKGALKNAFATDPVLSAALASGKLTIQASLSDSRTDLD